MEIETMDKGGAGAQIKTVRFPFYLFILIPLWTVLASCGGGGGGGVSGGGNSKSAGAPGSGSSPPASPSNGVPGANQPPAAGTTIVSVNFQNASSSAGANLPVTFGQAFVRGHVPSGTTVVARTAGAGSQSVPMQVDATATHSDGSLRYAVLSARLPSIAGSATQAIELVSTPPTTPPASVTVAQLLGSAYDAEVVLNVGGVTYSASVRNLIQPSSKTWLQGPLVTEWLLSSPLKTAAGVAHPQLSVRFDVRAYAGIDRVRTDVILENTWTYEPSPQNVPYGITVKIGGATAYSASITHYSQSRWHKTFWYGSDPQLDAKFDKTYLMATGAVPNYDPTLVISSATLNSLASGFSGSATEPMGAGSADPSMPDAGGRPDIGPLPSWDAMYLVSGGDVRAKRVSLGNGDLGGSWPIHYRDKNTDLPVTLINFPYMTILGNESDTRNPATGKLEAFPHCAGNCDTPFDPDSAHQPSFAYLPFLVTGDHYYLEELQFWAGWNALIGNPAFRDHEKGLIKWNQVRGQAWSMRTLGNAAYITPDANPLKSYFVGMLQNNLTWYNDTYINNTNNANANVLGIITNGAAVVYEDDQGTPARGVASWQDDFFTWSIGYLAGMGFTDATPLLQWKAKFPVGRMTDPGYCWISGSAYSINIRDTETSPFYTTFSQVYLATIKPSVTSTVCASQAMANALGLSLHDMGGFSSSAEGYPSNTQPALAVAAEFGLPNASAAWSVFLSRSVKPDYSVEPNFAIVPR